MLRRNDPGSQRLSPPGVRVSMVEIMLDPEAGEGLSGVASISLPGSGDVDERLRNSKQQEVISQKP